MLQPGKIDDMAAALRHYDPSLTEEEAEDAAVEIGDTPFIIDGMVQTVRGGKPWEVPAEVLFADDE